MKLIITGRSGAQKVLCSASQGGLVKYLVSIGVSDQRSQRPPYGYTFTRARKIRLDFWDIDEELETLPGGAKRHGPSKLEITRLVEWAKGIDMTQEGIFLSHCAMGVSRSTAAAYICLCVAYGPGQEKRACHEMYMAASYAFPNPWMIQLASEILGRDLVTSWKEYRAGEGVPDWDAAWAKYLDGDKMALERCYEKHLAWKAQKELDS